MSVGTGYGDGSYPVYARFEKGRCLGEMVAFDEGPEDEEEDPEVEDDDPEEEE